MASPIQRPNTPPAKRFESVEEYVKQLEGTKVIKKVLIANNGIAAVKGIRSIRSWAYEMFGDDRAVKFVVMATPEDLKSNAEYIRLADHWEQVQGGTNNNNYANVSLIVDVAERNEVDAVWAGWGHASENPNLPEALSKTKRGIVFIGPGAKAMDELGDKINSTILAQSVNVRCVPWSGSHVQINYNFEEGISKEVQSQATVDDYDELLEAVKHIGFPVMIKASEGGGGKGIRKASSMEDLEMAFRQVQGEVPGSPIFAMRMAPGCHHLEVQVLGDNYGDAVSLYGRDCSVQRRHQKILEEGPALAAPRKTLDEMERAAVRLARAVKYSGAGTVEYLYSDESGYFFLELNPRLQVEHPVTESITGVNLPAAQLNVAMGIPLHRIPDIRRFYNQEPFGDSKIDFYNEKQIEPKGHIIACRITAENAEDGFKPTSGSIQELTFRSTPRVWGYFSIQGMGDIHEFSDSQFGHLFAWGPEREDARKSLVMALKELSIRGDIHTPVEYLIKLIELEDFRNLTFHTGWLDELLVSKALKKEQASSSTPDVLSGIVCGAAFKAVSTLTARKTSYYWYLERGQVPPSDLLLTSDVIELIHDNIKYSFSTRITNTNTVVITLKDRSVEVDFRKMNDGSLILVFNERSFVVHGKEEALGLRLVVGGRNYFFTKEYDPTSLRTATAGKLVRYLVDDGALVKQGTPYAEMEVMKMYMPLLVPEDGHIHYKLHPGAVLQGGEIIAKLDLLDPSSIRASIPFDGELPEFKSPRAYSTKVNQLLRNVLSTLDAVLNGYSREKIAEQVVLLKEYTADCKLPLYEFREVIDNMGGRLAAPVREQINSVLSKYQIGVETVDSSIISIKFPTEVIIQILDDYERSVKPSVAAEFHQLSEPIRQLAVQYLEGRLEGILQGLLRRFLNTELMFEKKNKEDVFFDIRQKYKNEWDTVYLLALSRSPSSKKYELIQILLRLIMDKKEIEIFVQLMHDLAGLNNKECIDVSVSARQLLIQYQLPSFKQRQVSIEETLRRAMAESKPEARHAILTSLIDQSASLFDVLVSFFSHSNPGIRQLATEVYILRSYKAYDIHTLTYSEDSNLPRLEWKFITPDLIPPPISSSTHQSDPTTSMRKVESIDNLYTGDDVGDHLRAGLMVIFPTVNELFSRFNEALQRFQPEHISYKSENINVMKFCIMEDCEEEEESFINMLTDFFTLSENKENLRELGVRRITVMLCGPEKFPRYFTFRERLEYKEDPTSRHIEPPLAYHLELSRLSNYNITYIPTLNRQIHLYYATEKEGPNPSSCFFVRFLVRPGDTLSNPAISDYNVLVTQAEKVLVDGIKSLEVAVREKRFSGAQNHHIFLKIITEVNYEPENVNVLLRTLGDKYGKRLWKLRVGKLELAGRVRRGNSVTNLRFTVVNPTGYLFEVHGYLEVKDSRTNTTYLNSITGPNAPDDNMPQNHPYPVLSSVQKKRFLAQNHGTTYCYDLPTLFRAATIREWENYSKFAAEHGVKVTRPSNVVVCKEMMLNINQELVEVSRPVGSNDIAMVVWKLTIFLPSSPEGREIIVIANDITVQIGSFGPEEDRLFNAASVYARKLGIPRIYVACNSGARIGLADEVKNVFKVRWNDPNDPLKGYQYLTVDEEVKNKLGEAIFTSGEDNRITDIVGLQEGLGVENLQGSGMIAGETSQAYDEIFTITLATGRTVGIGAYLVRLGQRTVQTEAPIILTGAQAINKLLGREVYRSNVQLGGIQIMYRNGVSHIDVQDDYRGIVAIVQWLSYIPVRKGAIPPTLNMFDPVDREIEFVPPSSPYDPVHMLAGYTEESGKWISGFFDKDSWKETLAGWARTVICGRARLGGIPMGVIAVETRSVEQVVPADPANPESQEQILVKAGQVWYPDSAYKTAQAISDFNKGEELPLMIFANWRGFSGGMRDMFDEILKFGSYIVDNLHTYRHPVFIYIPPNGELRGGAWVVLDPTINPEMMEMYCDSQGCGGVLESSGTVEIKFRMKDQLNTMRRLDTVLIELYQELEKAKQAGAPPSSIQEIQKKINAREKILSPMYLQIAQTFAELHDTPGRMKAKGCIREVIEWKNARQYFYNRVRRRVYECRLLKRLKEAALCLSCTEAKEILHTAVPENVWNNDKEMADWLSNEENVEKLVSDQRTAFIKKQLAELYQENPQVVSAALKELVK